MEFNTPDFRRSECPSANGNCSARGLAKLASFMANKGMLFIIIKFRNIFSLLY